MANSKANSTVPGSSNIKELKHRIFLTIVILVIYRFGTYIPLPGINPNIFNQINSQGGSGILGMLNMFSGGALGRMTIFSLNVMPYITASIIMQLMGTASKQLAELKKEGEEGRKRINQYTRYLTVILAIFQGYGISSGIYNLSLNSGAPVLYSAFLFKVSNVVTLTASTLFLMWLGEQITSRGIGNGVSLIIFAGIVAELPSALISTLELGRTGALSTLFILAIVLLILALLVLIIFMERSFRKIIIQYPKVNTGYSAHNAKSSHIPLKINTSGVIPPIFASSLLLFPITMVSFNNDVDPSAMASFISTNFTHGKPLFMIAFTALIMFFSFFYTAVVFNTEETANYLKKANGFIPGIRPGQQTAEYLDNVLTRITLLGAMYLSFVCLVPEIIISKYSLPFYFGGTSLLIVVNVAIDTVSQVQVHLLSNKYDNLVQRTRIRIR
jgi:preprotein translocase subunit SecY